MGVLYASFESRVRPRTCGCAAMRSAVLFILRSRLLLYSAGSGVNRVQFVLSGFSVILFSPEIYVGIVVCILGCTRACVCRCDGNVICVGHDLNLCSGWGVCSVNVE